MKCKSLLEKIDGVISRWIIDEITEKQLNSYFLRLIREDQKRKCEECHSQVVENIKAREMDRLIMPADKK